MVQGHTYSCYSVLFVYTLQAQMNMVWRSSRQPVKLVKSLWASAPRCHSASSMFSRDAVFHTRTTSGPQSQGTDGPLNTSGRFSRAKASSTKARMKAGTPLQMKVSSLQLKSRTAQTPREDRSKYPPRADTRYHPSIYRRSIRPLQARRRGRHLGSHSPYCTPLSRSVHDCVIFRIFRDYCGEWRQVYCYNMADGLRIAAHRKSLMRYLCIYI